MAPSRARLYCGGAAAGYVCYALYRRWSRGVPLRGATVVISGASAGIGAALAKECAKRGSKVYLLARNEEALDKVVAEIGRENAVALRCDCSDAAQVAKVAEAVGVPTVLVNNAGAGAWRFLNEAPASDVTFCLGAPYVAAALLSREFAPKMIRSGKKSSILAVQSPAGLLAVPGATSYVCARWALRGLYESLVQDCYSSSVNSQMAVFGEVSSEYFSTNAGAADRLPKIAKWIMPILTPEAAAVVAADQIESGRAVVFAPFMLRVVAGLNHVCAPAVRALVVATSSVSSADFARGA